MRRVVMLIGGAALAIAFSVSGSTTGYAQTGASGDPEKGKVVYTELKCSLCHKIGDAGGPMGPALNDVGDKRDAAWLAAYLPEPKSVNEENKMPPTKATGEDLDNLIAYLLTLKASHDSR